MCTGPELYRARVDVRGGGGSNNTLAIFFFSPCPPPDPRSHSVSLLQEGRVKVAEKPPPRPPSGRTNVDLRS